MTSTQFSVLSIVAQSSNITIARLAQVMEFERTTLVRTLKPMKELGWIAENAEKVGRARTLYVTSSGVAKLDEGLSYWEAAQKEFEGLVGKDTAALFLGVMHMVTPPISI
jgi:DNA-binding MarR family transcriptional regulator